MLPWRRIVIAVLGIAAVGAIGLLLLLFVPGTWDGDSRYTLVIGSKNEGNVPVALFSIEPRVGRAVYLPVSEQAMLSVPYGYGEYRAGAVYRLGQLDAKRNGGMLLANSVATTFSLPVHSYIVGSAPFLKPTDQKEDILTYKRRYFSLLGGLQLLLWGPRSETNIGFIDRVRLWRAVRSLRSDAILFIDIADAGVYEERLFADKTVGLSVNMDVFDLLLGETFHDSVIRAEHTSLEVVNATGQERLATTFAEILRHAGANVIQKSTARENEKRSCVIAFGQTQNKNSAIITFLEDYYRCAVDEKNPAVSSTADLVVILGEGFLQ